MGFDQFVEKLRNHPLFDANDVLTKQNHQAFEDAAWTAFLDHPHSPEKPLVVVRIKNAEQIQECVKLAYLEGLKVSVKSGGHGWLNFSIYNEVCLELHTHMQKIEVHWGISPETSYVDVDSGVFVYDLHKQLDQTDWPFDKTGRKCTAICGYCDEQCVGGTIAGGGVSLLSREHGLAIDSVIAIDIVLATGEFKTVRKDSDTKADQDLFNAFLGGGSSNFGVCTKFRLKLYPIPSRVLYAKLTFPNQYLEKAIAYIQKLMPDETQIHPFFYLSVIKHKERNPNAYECNLQMAYLDSDQRQFFIKMYDELIVLLNPTDLLVTFGSYGKVISTVGYTQRPGENSYGRFHAWLRPMFFKDFSDHNGIANVLRTRLQEAVTRLPNADVVEFQTMFMGGKILHYPDVGVVSFRGQIFYTAIQIYYFKETDLDPNPEQWGLEFAEELIRKGYVVDPPLQYVNFRYQPEHGEDKETLHKQYYGEHNLKLLKEVKNRCDPNNLFEYPQGIDP